MRRNLTSESHKSFCKSVIALAKAYATVTSLKNKVSNGEVLEDEEVIQLKQLMHEISDLMHEIEKKEEVLGYEGIGLPFINDANFNGFFIKNGELAGDLENAYLVAEPWYTSFIYGDKTESSDCFKFIISAFIIHMTDMLDPVVFNEVMEDYCRDSAIAKQLIGA